MTAEVDAATSPDFKIDPYALTPGRRMPRRLRMMLALDDFEEAARRVLPRPIFGYYAGAAETNASLRDNREVFSEYRFRPRVLTDVSGRSHATTLLGKPYDAPIGIAPMGISALVAYRGDLVLARAAEQAGIPMIMSGSSLIPLEDVIEAAPSAWFQAYLPGEPERIEALIDRVAAAGFGTLVLTADVAVLANRENNTRNGFSTPFRPSPRLVWDGLIRPSWTINTLIKTIVRHGMPHFENSDAARGAPIFSANVSRNFGRRSHLNWEHFELMRRRWKGRLVVKGILTGDDAARAREAGADGVIVSNHGGRQLDGAISAVRAIEEVKSVAGDMAVMADGGFRRGTDVLKALALGADHVFLGRPFAFAAAVGGEDGVTLAINILKSEINRDMALLGINTLEEMSRDRLVRLARSDA